MWFSRSNSIEKDPKFGSGLYQFLHRRYKKSDLPKIKILRSLVKTTENICAALNEKEV